MVGRTTSAILVLHIVGATMVIVVPCDDVPLLFHAKLTPTYGLEGQPFDHRRLSVHRRPAQPVPRELPRIAVMVRMSPPCRASIAAHLRRWDRGSKLWLAPLAAVIPSHLRIVWFLCDFLGFLASLRQKRSCPTCWRAFSSAFQVGDKRLVNEIPDRHRLVITHPERNSCQKSEVSNTSRRL